METTIPKESREYPSRLFFVDLLLKEVLNTSESGKTLPELLDQLRVIWTVPNREAVLNQLEYHIHEHRSDNSLHEQVAQTLTELVSIADGLKPGDRQKIDFSVSRIIKHLDSELQMNVIAPWLHESRKFRCKAVLRCLSRLGDLDPYADFLVRQYREHQEIDALKLIGASRAAASQIAPEELDPYLQPYLERLATRHLEYGREHKYLAMIAARVLIAGGQTIPRELLSSIPEVFTWAIDDLKDPEYESMLTWLIVENASNPEVLWSAIRTASRRFMPTALERGVHTARSLLSQEFGVVMVDPERQIRLDLG